MRGTKNSTDIALCKGNDNREQCRRDKQKNVKNTECMEINILVKSDM